MISDLFHILGIDVGIIFVGSISLGCFFLVRLIIALFRREHHFHWSRYYFIGMPICLLGYPTIFIGGILLQGVGVAIYAFGLWKLVTTPLDVTAQVSYREPANVEVVWPPAPSETQDNQNASPL